MNKWVKLIRYLYLVGICWIVGCHDDTVNNPLIDQEAPAIRLIEPDTSTILSQAGDSLRLVFQLADNKGLKEISVTRSVKSIEGNYVEWDSLILTDPLMGKTIAYDFRTLLPFYPDFSRVTYQFSLQDQKGQLDDVSVTVRLLSSKARLSSSFQTNQYKRKKLYNAMSDSSSGFNFTTQTFFLKPFANVLDVDIAEQSVGDNFAASLSSPNNTYLAREATFVILDSTQINFEEANYDIILQSYLTAATYYDTTPSLEVDDLIIVSLIKAPSPQFALIKINQKVDEIGRSEDYIEFDYKVSSE